jgi:hypothetical protein
MRIKMERWREDWQIGVAAIIKLNKREQAKLLKLLQSLPDGEDIQLAFGYLNQAYLPEVECGELIFEQVAELDDDWEEWKQFGTLEAMVAEDVKALQEILQAGRERRKCTAMTARKLSWKEVVEKVGEDAVATVVYLYFDELAREIDKRASDYADPIALGGEKS